MLKHLLSTLVYAGVFAALVLLFKGNQTFVYFHYPLGQGSYSLAFLLLCAFISGVCVTLLCLLSFIVRMHKKNWQLRHKSY